MNLLVKMMKFIIVSRMKLFLMPNEVPQKSKTPVDLVKKRCQYLPLRSGVPIVLLNSWNCREDKN